MQIKNNPRIKVTITPDNVICNGIYINHNGDSYSINMKFESEDEALDYLTTMRDNDNAEFSIILARK
jgi:hypothetical protein